MLFQTAVSSCMRENIKYKRKTATFENFEILEELLF
jgi:hypothetical protein